MGISEIFDVIKELLGIAKPFLDQDQKNKDATVGAIKKSGEEPSLSVDLNDKHDKYIEELKKPKEP